LEKPQPRWVGILKFRQPSTLIISKRALKTDRRALKYETERKRETLHLEHS
jgi:hypothetical protein